MEEASIEALGSEEPSDSDSGFSETGSTTASIRSSIFDYEEEYGRSYHAFRKGKYVMPNDEGEQERMDIHYHAIRIAFSDKHFFAPITPTSVLDVGTGTGIWAMDIADDYPAAQVLGIDLSPIQPGMVPPNLEFQIADADESWDFGAERFDFVHTRLMNGFSIKSWPHFFQEAFASLRPGGWVENQEFDLSFRCDDGTLPEDSHMIQWINLWNEGIQKMGLTARCYPEQMKEQMKEAGFVNVSSTFHRVPIGGWPKDKRLRRSGLFSLLGLLEGLSGLSQRVFVHGLGWRVEEMEVLLAHVRTELQNRRIHSYWPIYVVTGQKPPR